MHYQWMEETRYQHLSAGFRLSAAAAAAAAALPGIRQTRTHVTYLLSAMTNACCIPAVSAIHAQCKLTMMTMMTQGFLSAGSCRVSDPAPKNETRHVQIETRHLQLEIRYFSPHGWLIISTSKS